MYEELVHAVQTGNQAAALRATGLSEVQRMLKRHWSQLKAHPEQLRTLLADALYGLDDDDAESLLDDIYASEGCWLEPLSPLRSGLAPKVTKAHSKDVKGIVMLDDGRMLTASEDGTVRVWEHNIAKQTLRWHSGAINSLVRVEDRLVSAGDDRTIQIWDAETLEPRKTITSHSGYVSKAVMAGDTIASVSRDQKVGFNGEGIDGHRSWVQGMAASPDGQWLVTGSVGGGMLVWDVARQSVAHVLHPARAVRTVLGSIIAARLEDGFPHRSPAARFAWPTQDRMISVGKEIVVWDTTSWTPLQTIQAHSSTPRSIAVLNNGRRLVTADSTLKVWDLSPSSTGKGPLLLSFNPHEGRDVTSMAISLNGVTLYTGDKSGEVRHWNIRDLIQRPPRAAHSSGIRLPLLISEDQQVVLSGGNGDHSVLLWNTSDGMPIHCWRDAHKDKFVQPVAVNDRFVLTNARNELCVWDRSSGKQLHRLEHGTPYGSISAALLSESTLVSGDLNGPLAEWDLQSGTVKPLQAAIPHPLSIQDLGDGRLLVASYAQNASPLKIVDQSTGEILQELAGGPQGQAVYRQALITPFTIYALTADGRVSAWSRETGELHHDITIPDCKPERIWALPDGSIALLSPRPGGLWVLSEDLSSSQHMALGELFWYPAVRDDGCLMIGKNKDQMRVVRVSDATLQTSFTPDSEIRALALHKETIAIGLADGRVLVFRIHNA